EPFAVVLKLSDYQRLSMAQSEQRQRAARELDALLARVHARTQHVSDSEIETDIVAARQEVREQRYGAHRSS
ncbi:MAG: hypothetical protein ABI874_12375, partial [Chloroflexota bacterium]